MVQYKLEVITKTSGTVRHIYDDLKVKDIDQLRHFLPRLYEHELRDGVIEVRSSNNRYLGVFAFNIPWGCYVWLNKKGKTRVSPVNGSLIGETAPHKHR